ncbi:MAG: DUF4139 domain-containing protein, partial [Gemmatimonadales bacterium]
MGLALMALTHATALAAQTSLSVYSDGRVVVRRTLAQALERGTNRLTLRLEGLDPSTLFSPDSSVSVVAATVRYPSGRENALGRAVGQTIAFVRGHGDTVRATVLRAEPPQFRLPDGRLLLSLPGEPLFPAELVRTVPEASVTIEAARARPRTELAYLVEGVTWGATYQVVLGRGQATVNGTATVASQTLKADSAEIQLVAGSIRRVSRQRFEDLQSRGVAMEARAAAPEPYMAEQVVGETHVYDLPGRIGLEPGVPTSVALFPRAAAAYSQELIVPGVLPWRGWLGPQPPGAEPNRVPVQVWYTFKRGRGTAFGDRPLPGGVVQLYQPDAQGRVQLIGEAATEHQAPGRDLRVQSGDAFDVTAERVQTDYNQETLPPLRRGLPNRQRATAALRVTISNAKAEPVTVDLREVRWGEWRIVE